MNTNGFRDLASVIVPCWNQLEFTRRCVSALVRHTRPPWELILVDNGSTDGTRDYCAGVQDGASVPVTVVANAANLGFPAAINQGLQLAHGEYLVLLNNDVVVTDCWLDQLVALASAERRPTAEHQVEDRASIRFTAEGDERAERETETENGTVRIFDFNEVLAARGRGSAPVAELVDVVASDSDRPVSPALLAQCPPPLTPPWQPALLAQGPPPLTPPSQGGESGRIGAVSRKRERDSPPARPIGLVGPMSNYAAPPQLVDGVPYDDLEAMHGFARRWRDEHLGRWFTVPKLSGFCLLMKRAVYDKIGGLDERFGIGFFDDDDLAERARRAGFDFAVAHDLFVHHFGSRTFVGNKVDAEALLDQNAQRFAAKWGLQEHRGTRIALRPFALRPHKGEEEGSGPQSQSNGDGPQMTPMDADQEGAPSDSASSDPWPSASSLVDELPSFSISAPPVSLLADLRPSASSADKTLPPVTHWPASPKPFPSRSADNAARISLTMIVKNEQKNLPHCLTSVAGVFDEIVVVDTGSDDDTVEIARSFGAKVFEFPWVDSFSAARNNALEHATGDYAFWLDADDVVEPAERAKLQGLLDRVRAGELRPAGFVVRCACDPEPDGTGGNTVVDHIRLFPLRDDVRWKYRVHEQILPALNVARVPVCWTDIHVRHTGYTDHETRARKLDRDLRLCHLELIDNPDEPFVLFNVGAISLERCQWLEALGFLERSLSRSAPTDSITRKLFVMISRAHEMMGDLQKALEACATGLRLESDNAELWFRKAVAHRHRGESRQAEACWRRILELKRPNRFCSFDQGIYGHVTRRNLATLAAERGDQAEAQRLWTEVLAECPADRVAMANLVAGG